MRAGSTYLRRQSTTVFIIVLVLHVMLFYLLSATGGMRLKPPQDTQPLKLSFVMKHASGTERSQSSQAISTKTIEQPTPNIPAEKSINKPTEKAVEKLPAKPQSVPALETPALQVETKRTASEISTKKPRGTDQTITKSVPNSNTKPTSANENGNAPNDADKILATGTEQATQPQQPETESVDPLAAVYAQQQRDTQAENNLLDEFAHESARQHSTEAFGRHLDFPASSNWGKLDDESSQRPDAVYTRQVRAKHPEDERQRGREGIVAIEFTIDTQGAVVADSINIISATSDSFAFEATAALLASSFQVQMFEGVAVAQAVKTSIVFPLD